jgi:Bacterial extracellular solute-binding protein
MRNRPRWLDSALSLPGATRVLRRRRHVPALGLAGGLGLAAAALLASGCGLAGAGGGGGAGSHGVALRVAIVANPQMQDVEALTKYFQQQNPDVKVNFVTLPENESRAKITASVSTKSNEFDVVMISNYETPMWARYGWLTDLQPYMDRTAGYDALDFIPSIRSSLSYNGHMFSVPFYGESSFLMYRKDMFAKAGLQMPPQPTWSQVASFAQRLTNKHTGVAGICLRGQSGWGQVLAPLDTVINTFGDAGTTSVGMRSSPRRRSSGRFPSTSAWFSATVSRAPGRTAFRSARPTTSRARRRCGTTQHRPPARSRAPRPAPSWGRLAMSARP